MKQLHMFFAILLLAGAARATEHWKVYSADEVPWSSVYAIVVFNNSLHVAGLPKTGVDTLWSSEDGETWNSVALPSPKLILSFSIHQGDLYGFGITPSTGTQEGGHRSVYRHKNGTWNVYDDGSSEFNQINGSWSDSLSYGDYVYVGDYKGKVWRSRGDTAVPVWESFHISQAISDEPTRISFAVIDGLLHGSEARSSFPPNSSIWSSNGTMPWQFETVYGNENLRPGTVNFNNRIYWGGLYLKEINPVDLHSPENHLVGNLPTPFVLNNQLHAFGPSSRVLALGPNGLWKDTIQDIQSLCATEQSHFSKAVEFKGDTYIIPCDMMRIRHGLHAVKQDNFIGGTLSAGQEQATVLPLSFDINFNETIEEFEVVNLETARAGTDIERVRLFRSTLGTSAPEFLIELDADVGGTTWKAPSPFAVNDGDKIFVTVDVARHARLGTKCLFAVESNKIKPGINTRFTFSTIVAPAAQTIANAGFAIEPPLEGAIVFPSPARNQVNFQYTLTETSHVTIDIFNSEGQLVSRIGETSQPANNRASATLNATSIPSGIYYALIKIQSANGDRTIKKKVAIEK